MFSKQSHSSLVALGYWRASLEDKSSDLPFPSEHIDDGWDPLELCVVAEYIAKSQPIEHSKGWSECRLCGELLGTACLTDDTYIFPEKFEHYLLAHDVKPPQQFIDHVWKNRK